MLIFIHKHRGFSEINNRNIQITNNKKGYGNKVVKVINKIVKH